jgi:aminocarboxymuconate-semialdehyde decarboxylase
MIQDNKIRIDVHNHIYTRKHLAAIAEFGPTTGWSIAKNRKNGRDMLYGERGYPFILSKSCYDMEQRIKELDAAGISMQVMSPSEPFFDFLPVSESMKLVREVNDSVAKITETYPTRFAGLAGLPLNDVGAAIEEVKRAVRDLGLKGVIVPTKVRGERAISSPEFDDLFDEFDTLGIPVFIHPTLPVGAERYKDYFLGMIVLYPNETSITIAEMLFRGLLEKYQKMKIMVGDLGGALPLLAGRMHRFFVGIEESRKNLRREPLEYLRKLYYENGSEFYKHSMSCCYEFAGPRQILLGTNHPSPIVAFNDAVNSIKQLDASAVEKEMMLYRNAKELFSLDSV